MTERAPSEWVYLATAGRHQKIGISSDPKTRVAELGRFDNKMTVLICCWHRPMNARDIERYIKRKLRPFRSHSHMSEWFKITKDEMHDYVSAVVKWYDGGDYPSPLQLKRKR